jgi:hypothetical protein
MLIHQQEELNVIERSTCNYSYPTWKPTSHIMAAKVLQIASWVLVRLLLWAQRKMWIPIGSMGNVHTHQKILAIEIWGSPSCVWSAMEKNGENNWKAGKTGQVVNQAFAPGLEHDKIWAWWALDVPLKNKLERVWWCRHFEMESWNWTICCPMSCSNGRRHVWAGGGRRSHVALRCC